MGASRSVSGPRSLGSRRRGTTIAAAAVSLALVVSAVQAVTDTPEFAEAQVSADRASSTKVKLPDTDLPLEIRTGGWERLKLELVDPEEPVWVVIRDGDGVEISADIRKSGEDNTLWTYDILVSDSPQTLRGTIEIFDSAGNRIHDDPFPVLFITPGSDADYSPSYLPFGTFRENQIGSVVREPVPPADLDKPNPVEVVYRSLAEHSVWKYGYDALTREYLIHVPSLEDMARSYDARFEGKPVDWNRFIQAAPSDDEAVLTFRFADGSERDLRVVSSIELDRPSDNGGGWTFWAMEGDPDGDEVDTATEVLAGSNPFDSNSKPAKITPIPEQQVTTGEYLSIPVEVSNMPNGSRIEVRGLPETMSYSDLGQRIVGVVNERSEFEVTVSLVDEDGSSIFGADGFAIQTTFRILAEPLEISAPAMADWDQIHFEEGVSGYPGEKVRLRAIFYSSDKVVDEPTNIRYSYSPPVVGALGGGVFEVRVPENAVPGTTIAVPVEAIYTDESSNVAVGVVQVIARPTPTTAPSTPKPTTPAPSLARPTVSVAPDSAERYSDRYTPTFPTAYARADKTSLSVDPLATLHDQGEMFDNQPLPVGTTLKAKTPGTQIVRVPGEDGTIRQLVEYTPPADAAPGEVHEVTVEVVYPDGSVDEVLVPFEIVEKTQADETPLGYESGKAAAPNRAVKIVQTGTRDLPADVEFIAGHKNDLRGWRVSVDPHTGDLRATAPENATPLSFTTVALFADGSTKEITTIIGVAEARVDADQYQPVYREAVAKAGEQATSARHGNVGANTSFALADAAGLADVVVDKRNGTFKATVPANAVPGTRYFPVLEVRYADGSSEFITAEVVADSIARTAKPEWAELSVPVGDTTSEDTKRDVPDNTTFALKDTFEAPNWDVSIDPATGELTVRADENVRVDEEVVIPVVATFEDNSQKEVKVRAKAAKRTKPTAQTPTPPTSKVVTTTVTAPAPPAQNSGSSVGSILALVLGALALIGGAGFAAVQNQDLIRDVLRQNGINF